MEIGPIIKNPVLDINKLVLQGTMLNQGVQNVEGDSTADQATTDLLAKKDPVIHEISVGMSGEEASQYTVSGTPPLSLPNSLGKPLKAWSVGLLPYQEGTGDPAPDNIRPIHGTDKVTITTAGKNLIDDAQRTAIGNNIRYYYANKRTLLLLKNVAYTFSSSATPSQIQVFDDTDVRIANSFNPSLTFTPSSDVYVHIDFYYTSGNIPSEGIGSINCQLEFGSTATPYTPYLAPSQTVITLPSTVYTATIGESGGESRSAEVDLSTLSWALRETGSVNKVFSSSLPEPYLGYSTDASMSGKWLTDTYKYQGTSNAVALIPNVDTSEVGVYSFRNSGSSTSVIYLVLPLSDSTTALGKLVYELATPTTLSVPSVTIPTPKGTATTWATAEDGTVDSMEVTYVGKA